MLRLLLLPLLCTISLVAAEAAPLTPDDLHGAWELDGKAVTKEQQAAADQAKAVEGYGITFTLRTARVIISEEDGVAGMWRLDDATPTTATLVIQPKGSEERTFHLTLEKDRKHLTVAEWPAKLPLVKTR